MPGSIIEEIYQENLKKIEDLYIEDYRLKVMPIEEELNEKIKEKTINTVPKIKDKYGSKVRAYAYRPRGITEKRSTITGKIIYTYIEYLETPKIYIDVPKKVKIFGKDKEKERICEILRHDGWNEYSEGLFNKEIEITSEKIKDLKRRADIERNIIDNITSKRLEKLNKWKEEQKNKIIEQFKIDPFILEVD